MGTAPNATVDTRWWSLSLGVLALAAGCGPTVVLQGDTDAGATTGGRPDEAGGENPTGVEIPCVADEQCPARFVCTDLLCVRGAAEGEADDGEIDDGEVGEDDGYYEDGYEDHYDVGCYEYGPRGQCCDYDECPAYCGSPDDCSDNETCGIGPEYDDPICVPASALPDCGFELQFQPVDLLGGDIVSLAFVELDGALPRELVIGGAAGGAEIVSLAADGITGSIPGPSIVRDAVSADFTGDGVADLAVGHGEGVSVFPGDGLGGFGAALNTVFIGASDLQALDFDGDRDIDLAAQFEGLAGVLLNDGAGLLETPVALLVSGTVGTGGIATGSLDDATRDDVVISTTVADAAFFGQADPPPELDPDASGWLDPVWGERQLFTGTFDAAVTDVVVGTTSLASRTIVETRTEVSMLRLQVPVAARGLALDRMIPGSAPDLVMLAGAGLVVFKGSDGPGSAEPFECVAGGSLPFEPDSVAIGDFSGDNVADVAIAADGVLRVLLTQ